MKSSNVGKFFLVTVLTLISSMVSAQNLIVNGSFEEPVVVADDWPGYLDAGSLTGWTITPSDLGHGVNNNSDVEPFHGGGRPIPDGNQVVFLQYQPEVATPIALSQVIEGLEEGEHYLLFFHAATRPAYPGMDFTVNLGNLELLSETRLNDTGVQPYESFVIPFVYTSEAVGDTSELIFEATWVQNADSTILFDNIQLRKPELSVNISGPTLIAQGNDVILSTELTEVTGDASYQWYYNGIELEGETGATLTLLDAMIEDSGVYSVEITDDANTITAAFTLLVVESLPISTLPVIALFGIALMLIGTATLRRV